MRTRVPFFVGHYRPKRVIPLPIFLFPSPNPSSLARLLVYDLSARIERKVIPVGKPPVLSHRRIEYFLVRSEAVVLGQDRLFLPGGKPLLSFQLLKQLNRLKISPQAASPARGLRLHPRLDREIARLRKQLRARTMA